MEYYTLIKSAEIVQLYIESNVSIVKIQSGGKIIKTLPNSGKNLERSTILSGFFNCCTIKSCSEVHQSKISEG